MIPKSSSGVIQLSQQRFSRFSVNNVPLFFSASLVMIMGYGIIAVPTGIVTVEISRASRGSVSIRTCPACNTSGHDANALYCKFCGAPL